MKGPDTSRTAITLAVIITAAVLLFTALFLDLAALGPVQAQTDGDCIEQDIRHNGRTVTLHSDGCHEPDPTATSTLQPTATATPTITATATATQTAQVEPYPDAPACASHDDRAYHSLWDAERGCHYDHSHNEDPHSVDDIFGTDYYGWAGGEVSYPWQTPDENLYKHAGYMWFVDRDLPCESAFTNGCIRAYRVQAHGMATALGTTTATHSVWIEALVCPEDDPDNCGIVRGGGHQGEADLVIDGERVLDRPDSANRVFLSYYDTGNRCCSTWYNGTQAGMLGAALEFGEMWETIPPYPTAEEIVANAERRPNADGSRVQLHNLLFAVPGRFADEIGTDYGGYTDRHGYPVDGCTEPGLDCVPFQVEGVPLGYLYQTRPAYDEMDVFFDGQSSGWIAYPAVEE